MQQEILEKLIIEGNIEEAVSVINQIVDQKIIGATGILLQYLKLTNNAKLRNAIAIALSDLECNEAVVTIIELLKDPQTLGYRGTLLYALENLECSQYINQFLELLFEGNFEVSRQALILINKKLTAKQERKWVIKKIENKLKSHVEVDREFLIEALEILR